MPNEIITMAKYTSTIKLKADMPKSKQINEGKKKIKFSKKNLPKK